MEDREKLLAELREKHGRIAAFDVPGHGLVVIKAPSQPEYERFVDTLAGDKGSKAQAMRTLALASTVYPERKEAQAIFAANPVLPAKLAARAQELGGSEIQELGNA